MGRGRRFRGGVASNLMPQVADPREFAAGWLPERPGARTPKSIADPIIEPGWGGALVAAALTSHEAVLYAGTEVEIPVELSLAIIDAFRALDAVILGHVTTDAFRTGEGTLPPAPPAERLPLFIPRIGRNKFENDPSVIAHEHHAGRGQALARAVDAMRRGERHAFVATDLLSLDGEAIDDVPILERKRLLEQVLVASELVRVSPFVKPSAQPTLVTWGMVGFSTLSWRDVNSRYLAGRDNPGWAIARAPHASSGPAAGNKTR